MKNELKNINSKSSLSLSSFSIILIMVVMMVIGGVLVPLLNVQYAPSEKKQSMTVSFSYPNVSARVVEQEVTSKIEGALSTIIGVDNVDARSTYGYGSVTLQFKSSKEIDVARFEVAMQIRQIYSQLPSGVSYPYINISQSGNSAQNQILTYTINANMPPKSIERYATETFIPAISKIDGIENAYLSGANPFYWVISYDPNIMRNIGLTINDIKNSFKEYNTSDLLGMASIGDRKISLTLKSYPSEDLLDTPIKDVEGRVIYLRDIATIEYKETPPTRYFRINGLNTITLTINGNDNINVITVATQVKELMEQLESQCPDNLTFSLSYDASERLKEEISTILFRSILSLIILLVFVLLVSRSFRYLALIFVSIVVNLFIAVIFYYVSDLQIELYSMAGITISLGIIIDTAIVMTDHYTYYRNRSVLGSVFGALVTTIASLSIIFLLPSEISGKFANFVLVIIINLSVSILIAALFIPALLDKFPINSKGVTKLSIDRKRKIVKFSQIYYRYITWARRHRWKFIVVVILGFGLPIHLLPNKLGAVSNGNITPENEKNLTRFEKLYNETIGSSWYNTKREKIEIVLGGSFRYFSKNMNSSSYYREPEIRKELTVVAAMPEGCNVHQLNEVIKSMENFLSQYSEIDVYRTNIYSVDNASLKITFTEESENTSFPTVLKQEIISKAMVLGGATWRVYGIDDNNFYNNVYSGYKQHGITISGYNYDNLYSYAEQLKTLLLENKRVTAPEIYASNNSTLPRNEYFIDYNMENIAATGLNVSKYYQYLSEQLYNEELGSIFKDGKVDKVQLVSSQKDAFDLWHIRNDIIDIDSIKTRLTEVGSIDKRRTGNDIYRSNQEYTLSVRFDFLGSYELSNRVKEVVVKKFNEEVLPLGYSAKVSGFGWWSRSEQQQQAWLILLVIVIIFGICTVIFESFKSACVIVLMIPIGLIGLFLTFAIGKFTFDQGGFAAIVMLCGIVVNAGIYITSEHYTILKNSKKSYLRSYLTAYNRKIVPTLLTIISTVLGLIPFLFEGTDEVFWFAFAVGVMGGMLFSVIALVFILPVFLKRTNE